MRGFGAGVIWGGALGLFGLGLASLMAPLPGAVDDAPPSQGAAAVTVPAGSEFARPRPDTEPVLPHGTPAPATAPAPRVPAPQAASAAPAPDTSLPVPSVSGSGMATGPSLEPPDPETAVPSPATVAEPAAAAPAATSLAAPATDAPPLRP